MIRAVNRWLRDQRLCRRLALGFGIVLLMLTAYGIFAVHEMSKLDDLIRQTHRHPMTVGNAVRETEIGILKIHRAMKDVAAAPAAEVAHLLLRVDEEESRVLERFELIEELFVGEKNRVREARLAFADWKEIRQHVIRLKLNGHTEAAGRITRDEGAARVRQLENKMMTVRQLSQARANQLRIEADDHLRQSRLITVGTLLLALALAGLVSWWITQSVRQPVEELSAASQAVSRGDLSRRARIDSRDELGELAQTFNAMVSSVQRKTETIRRQNQENERLLLAILPRPIARRLKQGEDTIADAFPEVSVLFADLVGFTPMSSRMGPEELVDLLNLLFSSFDELATRLKVEKIKTIGDAYMACCGLPKANRSHADTMVRLGLGMLDIVDTFNREKGASLELRVGVNTGPVVAGVIGRSKFIYDLWGDTVNTASRMESHGLPGAVQITQATHEALSDPGIFESRGMIEVKGMGPMEVFVSRAR